MNRRGTYERFQVFPRKVSKVWRFFLSRISAPRNHPRLLTAPEICWYSVWCKFQRTWSNRVLASRTLLLPRLDNRFRALAYPSRIFISIYVSNVNTYIVFGSKNLILQHRNERWNDSLSLSAISKVSAVKC